MKVNNLAGSVAKSLVLGLVILVAAGAFASNKASLQIMQTVQVNGQELPAGEYQLRWEGSGANVELSFMQGKKEIAKTSAKVVELDKASSYSTAVLDSSSGKAAVSEVHFAGKKTALAIGGADRASMGQSSSSK